MMRAWALAGLMLAATGCRETSAAAPPAPSLPEGAASAPAFTRESPPEPAEMAAAEPSNPGGDALAEAELQEGAPEEASEAAEKGEEAEKPEETEEPEETGPLPDVDIRNIGMHIGGEENTAEQKRPIRAEVTKHYDAMRRCYAKAVDPAKSATFGVDMRIPGDGGPPVITKPRSGLKGEGVKECLVAAFEAIQFPRQPNGQPRMVSYSIEFRRK